MNDFDIEVALRYECGRANKALGEQSGCAKLTEADVLAIRTQTGKISARQLAKQFGVSRYTIYDIVTRKSWKHLKPTAAPEA